MLHVKGWARWSSLINVHSFQVSMCQMALLHNAHISSRSGVCARHRGALGFCGVAGKLLEGIKIK